MQGQCDRMECRKEVFHRIEKHDIIADLSYDTKGSFNILKAQYVYKVEVIHCFRFDYWICSKSNSSSYGLLDVV